MIGRRKTGISGKIRRIFSLVTISAFILLGTLIFILMSKIYREELIRNYENITENITLRMEMNLKAIDDLAGTICSDTTFQKMVDRPKAESGYQYFRNIRDIAYELGRFVVLNNELVDDIYFMTVDNQVISRNPYYYPDTADSEWFQEFLKNEKRAFLTEIHTVTKIVNMSQNDTNDVLTYIVPMKSLTRSQKTLGYVLINLKADAMFLEADTFDGLYYGFFDEQKRLIKQSENICLEWDGLGEIRREENSIFGDFYFLRQMQNIKWTFVAKVEFSQINKALLRMIGVIIIALTTVLFFAELLIHLLVKNITQPLGQLSQDMDRFAKGNHDVRADIHSGDEIEQIACVFNEMVDNINEQMEQNVQREKEKRRSEVSFLMAQIKPHFIYNCLNSIIYMARQKEYEDIILFTRAFITVLQASIKKKPTEEVLLLSEIEYLKNYLTLMSYRYGYLPQLISEIEPSCEDVAIPALILQPVVENSILHGNSTEKKVNQIRIIAKRSGDRVEVHIKDDGSGIPLEKLEELRSQMKQSNANTKMTEHIGLMNVNERLKFCYGESSGLHIESIENIETDVWFER